MRLRLASQRRRQNFRLRAQIRHIAPADWTLAWRYAIRCITNDQAGALVRSLRPTIEYLRRFTARMESQGFPPNDPLLRDALQAADAMRQLNERVRHQACRGTGYAVSERTTKADDRVHYRLGYPRKDTH